MITTELFVLAQLFTPAEVSWWWIVLFIISDAGSLTIIKR